MDHLSYRTISANKETVNKEWILIDAENMVLGRLSSVIAIILRGKHKPDFTPHVDCGDNVVVINAEKINLTGKKLAEKEYISHSGYPGGQKIKTPEKLLKTKPEMVIEYAVKGMLPKNRLGKVIFSNLHVYAGTDHPHQAQKPKTIDLNAIR